VQAQKNMIVRKLTTRIQLSNRDVHNKSAEISMRKQVQAAAAVQALSEALRQKKRIQARTPIVLPHKTLTVFRGSFHSSPTAPFTGSDWPQVFLR
jgi:hypothetical protein